MTPPRLIVAAIVLSGLPALAFAQALTLDQAMALGLRANLDVRASAATRDEARARQDAARAAWFPRVGLQEGWQRGDQPVYAFGSLLAQRRFTAADFAVATLNRPDAIDNVRAAITLRQPVFDLPATAIRGRSTSAAAALAEAGLRIASADVALAIARAYGRMLSATADLRASDAAVSAATSARARAAARREAGTVTQADLLSLDVHLAQMQGRRVQAASDLTVARATLNRLLNRPLDTPLDVVEVVDTPDVTVIDTAAANPPEIAAAAARLAAADADVGAARAAWLPTVAAEGGWEWNGRTWTDRAQAWLIGVRADWTFSTGGAETAATRASRAARDRAVAQRDAAAANARLELVSAIAAIESARARAAIGTAAVAQARESERIIRDRYEAGLATVTDVLSAAQAVIDAESLSGSSRAELAVAIVTLRRAQGALP